MIAFMKPGESITMKVRRSGQDVSITVTIGELPGSGIQGSSMTQALGFLVEPVTPELAKQQNLDATSGLLVTRVDPDSLAFQAGLRTGQVILAVNGKVITTPEEFTTTLESAEKGGRVLLQIKIGSNIRFIAITIE
jgi:serine protease Do